MPGNRTSLAVPQTRRSGRRRRGGQRSTRGGRDLPSRVVRRQLTCVPSSSRVLRGSLLLTVQSRTTEGDPALIQCTRGDVSTAIEGLLGGTCSANWLWRPLKVTAFGLPISGSAGNDVPYCLLQAFGLAHEDWGSLAFVANVGVVPPVQELNEWLPIDTASAVVLCTGSWDLLQFSVEVIASSSALPNRVRDSRPTVVVVHEGGGAGASGAGASCCG